MDRWNVIIEWIRRLCKAAAAAAALFVLISAVLVLALRWLEPPTSAFMLRQRLQGAPVDYRFVPLARISPFAAVAVIASEDQNFFDHWGIDTDAIHAALKDNRRRRRPRGASTISQQTAKNLFLWQGGGYARKAVEAYLTLLVEAFWPKQRILEVYLNIAEMGRGVFGIEAASRRFFHKPASRLNLPEAATLAAVLPSPRRMHADRPSAYVIQRSWEIIEQVQMLGGASFLERQGMK